VHKKTTIICRKNRGLEDGEVGRLKSNSIDEALTLTPKHSRYGSNSRE
jgi:hypothetical protein